MKLEGDLAEIDLVQHLLGLAEERFTGAIRFENDGIIKILYFKEGDVLSASTNDRADSVDEILLRAGKVNRDHIRQALGKRKDSETLGDALLSLGFISRKELAWGRRTQIVGILRSVVGWPAGSYQIVHDYLPNREEGTLFHLPQIVLELAVTDPDKAKIEKRIGGGAAVFRKLPVFAERYGRLALNEDADAIVEQIDGEKSAAEVAAVSKLDVFAVYKLLLALESLGMIERDKPQVMHEVYAPEKELLSAVPVASPEPVEPAFAPAVGAGITEPPHVALDDGGPEEAYPAPSWSPPDLAAPPAVADPLDEEPVRTPPPPRAATRRPPLVLIVVLVLLLAAGGWWAWTWWFGGGDAEPVAANAPTGGRIVLPVEPAAVDSAPPAAIPAPTETVASDTAPESVVATPAPRPAPPAPAVVPADPKRAEYQRMAETFARERADVAYAVQFELVCQTESIARALDAGAKVWFIPVQYRGQPCYRVFWGTYATREEAESAKGEIPVALRGSGPVVVRPRELMR